VPFTYFDGSIYGPFSLGASGSIGFGIDNNIEMKLKSKKDTSAEGMKKIRLIDGFGVTSGYNLLADSFPLSPFSFYLRSNLFEKVNITATANMSPYQYDEATGFPINKYAWQGDDFSIGRITNGSLAISTQFQSKKADDKKESIDETLRDYNSSLTQDQLMMQLDYMRNNPSEFADFNIPWSLNLQYSLSFAQLFKPDYSGFETEFTSSISVQGDFNLTEKWKFGAYGFYDFNTNKVQSFTTFVSRDLHCWQMAINVNFAGRYKFFNISINPKSGLLRDLKVNRTRQFYSN
jgi:LPS-assembly protein